MSSLFDRRVEILIDDEVIVEARAGRQFKIMFEVLVDFGAFNSYCELVLANMAASTINKLKKGAKLTLKAGYVDRIDVIFIGYIKNYFPDRDGATSLSRVICRGGVSADDREPVNISLGKNSTITNIIKAVANSTGLPLVYNPTDFVSEPPYASGYTITADPERILTKLASIHGFEWVIENDRVVILKNESTRPGIPHIVSQFDGMEGKPEITEVGADVSVRLNPTVKVGDLFIIQSKYKTIQFSNLYFQDVPESAGQGQYKILRLSHSGDTHGDNWSTKLTGIRKPV